MSPPVLWIDVGNGAAGDMLLAGLLDAGADPQVVRAGLARLAVEPIALATAETRRHGFRARQVTVTAPVSTVHRGLAEVSEIVEAAELPEPVRAFATTAFTRLAEAEAQVHGTSVAQVHFHEVGALDAIADVVGAALALHDLGALDEAAIRVVSPVAVGSGTTHAQHGRLAVPVPAVLELLTAAGAPIAAHPAQAELCTPTGAALLVALADAWGPPPACTPRAVGTGAGAADRAEHPNVLRVLLGSGEGAGGWTEAEMHQVEATVDDLDPRAWPEVLERLRGAGAADAWAAPVLMRGGRPGHVLTALVPGERLDLLCRTIFRHTPTLGLRVHGVARRSLARDQIEVPVAGTTLPVKRGFLDGRVVTVMPEYAEAAELARRTGTPLAEILAAAQEAGSRAEGSPDAGGDGSVGGGRAEAEGAASSPV